MTDNNTTQTVQAIEPEGNITTAPEIETNEIQGPEIIIPETEPEVNDVDRELIFHAPEEEGDNND